MSIYASYTDSGHGYIAKIGLAGNLIATWDIGTDQNGVVQPFYNGLAVDGDDTIYYTTLGTKLNIIKRDKYGTILLTKVVSDVEAVYSIAIGPDGYIYTLEFAGYDIDWHISKRNASDLAVVDTMKISDAVSYELGGSKYTDVFHGLAIRSNGYIYFVKEYNTADSHERFYELWIWGNSTYSARLGTVNYPYACLSVIGVVMMNVTSNAHNTGVWRVENISSEDFETLEALNSPQNTGSDGTHFYFVGYEGTWADHVNLLIGKYESNLDKVWTLTISNSSNFVAGSICANITEVKGDYPLAPVMFPAKVQKSILREKCRNFEESMSDVCLVVNHNTTVTRRYLQETYGDTTHPESSNLRFILPSQQLIKLSNKDLIEEDFKAIINNFITNISNMFILINENNTLIKTWLDDYEPDEAGHEFTNVKMRPITIGEDLSKTMDNLFEGIIDNVTILNMNLEVLKERF